MLQAATSETIAPCPTCRQEMVLAVIIPAAPPLARHTYLCGNCNQTKTYILPVGPAVDEVGGDPDRPTRPTLVEHHPGRAEPRYKLATPATIAQIHKSPKPGIRGPELFDLTVTKGTSGTISGTFDLTPAQVQEIGQNRYYVQLHSEKAPDGNLWGWLFVQESRR